MDLTTALIIVLELAEQNVIDPREGDDYAEMAEEQWAAIERVSALLAEIQESM